MNVRSNFRPINTSLNPIYQFDGTYDSLKQNPFKSNIPSIDSNSSKFNTSSVSSDFSYGPSGNFPGNSFKESTATFTPKLTFSGGTNNMPGTSSGTLSRADIPFNSPSGSYIKNDYAQFSLGNNGNPVNSFFSPNSAYKPQNTSRGTSSGKGVTFSKAADGPRTFGLQFGSTPPGLSKLWTAQESKIAENAARMTQSTAKNVQTGVAAAKGVTATAGSMAGPVGMAAAVSQQIGSGINDAMSASENAQSKTDLMHNLNASSLDAGSHASIIHNSQQADITSRNTAGAIGSLFGPIGALVGHAVGGVNFDSSLLNTTGSLSGRVNGSDTGVAAAHSSAAQSGQTDLQQNV